MLPEIGSVKVTMGELAGRLAEEFAGELADMRVQAPQTIVAGLDRAKLHAVAERLHALPEHPYEVCNFIAAVDYETHFEVVYHLYSYATNTYLEIHVEVPRAKPVVDTVCDVWPSADWHEREAWDMMGIRFEGHPDLRRILLKDDFVGHPLRKDYIDLVENHPHA